MKPLLQFLLIVQAHYKAALITLLVTMASGLTISLLMPKQYTTTTSLVFDVKSPDPIAGVLLPVLPGYMATQMEIIKSDRVAQRVVKTLKLDESQAVKQQWLAATEGKGRLEEWLGELLKRSIQVTPVSGSNVITLGYRAGDPAFAALVANTYAQVYIDANIELRVDPARQYARWFGEQGKVMRENLEKAQARLSEFQQAEGIVAKDEQMDTETAKLTALSAQLTVVQGQTADARSKQRSGSDTLLEVMQSPMILGLNNEIVRQEAKLQEVAGNLGKNHPQYLRMESEIAALRKQLEQETRRVTSSFSTSSSVGQDREAQLTAAISAQKKKLLELRSQRDRLAVLQRDVDAAQSAYDGVTRRYNQTTLESQVTQTNVSVLSPAVVPREPSSPNLARNMLIALVLGFALGGGVAFLLELNNRRIRSVDDLAEMLQLPVLAVIERPREPNKLLFWRRKAAPALR